MAGRLQGKTALVTGATSNIGRAIAEAFAAEGAHVVISGRSAQRGAQVADGIGSRGGRADFVPAELDGSAEASRSLAGQAASVLGGRIDILVNNAGIYPGDSTAGTDEKTFDRVYAVNVKAPFFLTAAIAPAMAEAGSGAIINLGSWIARLGIPVGALYSSTKGAVETLTRAWAAEFGPHGVRVNAISPGVVLTPAPGEVHPGEVMMKGTPPAVPETLRPSRTPRSTSPATRPRSSTAACWTWTAAAPRRPSSPGSARTVAATACRAGIQGPGIGGCQGRPPSGEEGLRQLAPAPRPGRSREATPRCRPIPPPPLSRLSWSDIAAGLVSCGASVWMRRLCVELSHRS